MAVFIAIIILIIWQPKIKIPKTTKYFRIDYGIAPILGVLLLLVTLQTPISVVSTGIIGDENIQPLMIIVLFFSLAYICISIDITGFFAYLALVAAKKSGGSGRKLFFAFFLLSSFLTTFTSNDIVILTITPIIIYFCKYTKLNPIPYLFGQFFAANIWSIALYIGNPTNIIVSQAYNLSFLEYSSWMVLPTIFSGITCYLLLFLVFRKKISTTIEPPEIQPSSVLKDKPGSIFGLICLFSCLVLLAIAPVIKLNMGYITLIFASIMLVKDLIYDVYKIRKEKKNEVVSETYQTDEESANVKKIINIESNNDTILKNELNHPDNKKEQEKGSNKKETCKNKIKKYIINFPFKTVKTALFRMPWKIVFFVIGMFILVEALSFGGWVDLFAGVLTKVDNYIGLVPSIFLMCFLSALSCNIMNNQPMSIIFTKIIYNPNFVVSNIIEQGNLFSIVMGSNFGANFTLMGALAGILWSSIISQKDLKISYFQFAKYGFLIMPLIVVVAAIVLSIEFLIIY